MGNFLTSRSPASSVAGFAIVAGLHNAIVIGLLFGLAERIPMVT